MGSVTHPFDTEARALRVASSRVLLQAIVLAGVVACALLFVVGFVPASDASASGARAGSVVAQAQAIGADAGLSGSRAPAWTMAEIDDIAGDPRVVEPAPTALPHRLAPGFRPRGDTAPPVRASAPPDRPPRHV